MRFHVPSCPSYLDEIVVDPYDLPQGTLGKLVWNLVSATSLDAVVRERGAKIGREPYGVLWKAALSESRVPSGLQVPEHLAWMRGWAGEIERRGGGLLLNYRRFLDYLFQGTVLASRNAQKWTTRMEDPGQLELTPAVDEEFLPPIDFTGSVVMSTPRASRAGSTALEP